MNLSLASWILIVCASLYTRIRWKHWKKQPEERRVGDPFFGLTVASCVCLPNWAVMNASPELHIEWAATLLIILTLLIATACIVGALWMMRHPEDAT